MNIARYYSNWFALTVILSFVNAEISVAQPLLNLNFTADKNPQSQVKSGPAAMGFQADDYWNVYSRDVANLYDWRSEGTVSNLRWADGSESGASVSVMNAAGFWINGASDAMFNTFLYPLSGSSITVYVRNLPPGLYDMNLYGHGPLANQNGVFEVISGGVGYGTLATTTGSDWSSSQWAEGSQYVAFKKMLVTAGQPVVVTVKPGQSGYAILSGMQFMGVPEPSTYLAGLSALVMLGLFGWRNRK